MDTATLEGYRRLTAYVCGGSEQHSRQVAIASPRKTMNNLHLSAVNYVMHAWQLPCNFLPSTMQQKQDARKAGGLYCEWSYAINRLTDRFFFNTVIEVNRPIQFRLRETICMNMQIRRDVILGYPNGGRQCITAMENEPVFKAGA